MKQSLSAGQLSGAGVSIGTVGRSSKSSSIGGRQNGLVQARVSALRGLSCNHCALFCKS